MKVKTSKRLLAYVLDIVIFLIFTLIALLFIPSSDKVIELSKNLDKLGELVLEESITLGNYLTSSADIIQKIDKLELIPNGNHTFDNDEVALRNAIEKTVNFIKALI